MIHHRRGEFGDDLIPAPAGACQWPVVSDRMCPPGRREAGQQKTVKSVHTTSTKTLLKGLKKNLSYTVHVRADAKSSNGKYKASSAYVKKTVKTKR